MKEINLKEPLRNLRGVIYLDQNGKEMLIKDALLESIGNYRATGAEAVKIFALGQKILAADGVIELNDEEIKMAKDSFNQPSLPVAMVATVMRVLN